MNGQCALPHSFLTDFCALNPRSLQSRIGSAHYFSRSHETSSQAVLLSLYLTSHVRIAVETIETSCVRFAHRTESVLKVGRVTQGQGAKLSLAFRVRVVVNLSLCARCLGQTPRQQAFHWLNTRSPTVLCHSGIDGVHASVTVGDVDAPTLSMQTSSTKVVIVDTISEVKIAELQAVGVPVSATQFSTSLSEKKR